MIWVLKQADFCSATEGLVLVGIANHADAYGQNAWPSTQTLMSYTRMSESTVRRTLRELEERGVLVRGEQSVNDHVRADRRPVVWDLPMGANRTVLARPDLGVESSTDVQERPRGVKMTPRSPDNSSPRGVKSSANGVSPVTGEPYKREPSFLTSQRGALSSPENPDSVQLVSSDKRPPRKRSGSLRNVVAEEGPDTGRVVGKRGSTERAIRTHEARRTISRPNSGGGLAAEFGQRASEAGISGPQEVNGAALARSLTRWMGDGNNPDTPERIRSMMDAFFEKPGGSEDYPLWRRFLSEAPKLRNTERKSEPYDYAAASEREHERIKRDAARGDIRAQMELSGENRPWLEYVK